ncbi:MAG: glucose-1-phosphate adenylyltransferase [Granulosicoccus sp.]
MIYNPEETICILLAGGQGSRLHPLTEDRSKPSVPFGGKYRIVDFTLSNCLHSGLRQVLVLTQYKSHSLQKHLRDGWSIFSPEMGEYITVVPPQMRTGKSWYDGTADAIYQNLFLLKRSGAKRVLILSGDHIYRMDYEAILRKHAENEAALTVACMKVPVNEAHEFGVMAVDEQSRIVEFAEKPSQPTSLPNDPEHALASMGIYVFDTDILKTALEDDHNNESSSHDFGNDILPTLIQSSRVYGYEFGGSEGRVSRDRYWRDVGTIDSYYEANMNLLSTSPPLDLYQASWPIRTYQGQHPPARVVRGKNGEVGHVDNSMLGNGSVVSGGKVVNSILSARVKIHENADVQDSVIFDNVEIGSEVKLKRCIVDKHVKIPAGTQIGFDAKLDKQRYDVSPNGIVVVKK